ncbi:hypothetical protein BSIN_0019 [Burkholderia singularis]|uniref:Uncharacterized protein n=1 Tax=Burkholderia singularis TaxID=1503053 RepID=A0A238H2C7_9BURK|nr:hypothetical protein BSIN_0019 [Burkholderia singularis]
MPDNSLERAAGQLHPSPAASTLSPPREIHCAANRIRNLVR